MGQKGAKVDKSRMGDSAIPPPRFVILVYMRRFSIKCQADIHQSDLSLGQFPGTLQPDPTPAPSPADHGPSASPPLRSNNLQGPSAQPNKRKTSADSTSLKKQKLTGPGDSAQVWICQDGACLEYTFWGSEGYCMACAEKGSGNPNNIREECRFIHFRWWKLDVDDTYVIHFNDDSECFKDDGEKRFEYFAWTPRGIGSTNMIRVWVFFLKQRLVTHFLCSRLRLKLCCQS